MKTCSLCDRTEKTHYVGKESGICNCCEASIRYWAEKTPRQMIKRSRQIDSFQARMEILLGNIQRTSKKQRAA